VTVQFPAVGVRVIEAGHETNTGASLLAVTVTVKVVESVPVAFEA
jgi:hypothetical protein